MAEYALSSVAADGGEQDVACAVQFVSVFRMLGKRWNGMVIVALMARPARFSELAKMISGITDSILADRLRELMAANIVERQFGDGPGTTVLYRLTPMGEDLRPAFQELHAWADRNGFAEACKPLGGGARSTAEGRRTATGEPAR